jgi:hypothetical protein
LVFREYTHFKRRKREKEGTDTKSQKSRGKRVRVDKKIRFQNASRPKKGKEKHWH